MRDQSSVRTLDDVALGRHNALEELRTIGNPYPGLRPFVENEAEYFCGRDEQTAEILQRLYQEQCVAVLGGSGCGKSSIVRAGVIPALRLSQLRGRGGFWRVAVTRPGGTPMENLARALARALLHPSSSGRRDEAESEDMLAIQPMAARIRDMVVSDARHLGSLIDLFRGPSLYIEPGVSAELREEVNLFIFLDQFEEIFRMENRGRIETEEFVGLLMHFWRNHYSFDGVYVGLAMRTDDLHRCAEFIALPELINATCYLTRRLQPSELKSAIVEPVQPDMFLTGLLEPRPGHAVSDVRPYDVRVVAQLLDAVNEVAHDPDHLPLLQHLLNVLWRTAMERWGHQANKDGAAVAAVIELEDLARAVGHARWRDAVAARKEAYQRGEFGWLLRQCLDQTAHQLFAAAPHYPGPMFGVALTPAQQAVARTMFRLLGEIDDRGNIKRRWTSRREIAAVHGPKATAADVDAVLRRFYEDHRLLWVRGGGPDDLIDVSHEALLRCWSLARKWLTQDREAADAYRRVAERRDKWATSGGGSLLSWLPRPGRRQPELLDRRTLDRSEHLLARRRRWMRLLQLPVLEPLHTPAWAARCEPRIIANDAEIGRYQDVFAYLNRSLHANLIKRWSVPLIIVLSLLIVGLAEFHRESSIADARAKLGAAAIWSSLDRMISAEAPPEYIDQLWFLAQSDERLRIEFVSQIRYGRLRPLATHPLAVMRAVGLPWPPKAKQVVEQAVEKLVELRTDEIWFLPAFSCTFAILHDRLTPSARERWLDLLRLELKKAAAKSSTRSSEFKLLYALPRALSCLEKPALGAELYAKIVDRIVDVAKKAPSSEQIYLYTMRLDALAVLQRLSEAPPKTHAVIVDLLDDVIAQLPQERGNAFMGILMRSVNSGLITLDTFAQQEVMSSILATVAAHFEVTDSEALLVLAQAFERVGEQAPDVASRLVAHWRQMPEEARADPAVLRLVAPLVDRVDDETADNAARAQLTELVGDAVEQGGDDPPALVKATDLRVRALDYEAGEPIDDVDGEVSDLVKTFQRLRSRPDDDAPTMMLIGESLARYVAALFRRLPESVSGGAEIEAHRLELLEQSKCRIAHVGSAEEAAAWARAIVTLLEPEDDHAFVKKVLEVMRYPTTGLSARPPAAASPENASDILIASLERRLSESVPAWNPAITLTARSGDFRALLTALHDQAGVEPDDLPSLERPECSTEAPAA